MKITNYRSGGSGLYSALRTTRITDRRPLSEPFGIGLACNVWARREKCVQIPAMFRGMSPAAFPITFAQPNTATLSRSGPPCSPA